MQQAGFQVGALSLKKLGSQLEDLMQSKIVFFQFVLQWTSLNLNSFAYMHRLSDVTCGSFGAWWLQEWGLLLKRWMICRGQTWRPRKWHVTVRTWEDTFETNLVPAFLWPWAYTWDVYLRPTYLLSWKELTIPPIFGVDFFHLDIMLVDRPRVFMNLSFSDWRSFDKVMHLPS